MSDDQIPVEASAEAGSAAATLVPADRATALGETVLTAAGASPAAARAQVSQLVEADLRGRASHGMQRLPTLVERIRNRVLDPAAEPVIEVSRPGSIVADGRFGFGPVTVLAALPVLRDAARRTGIAMVAIRNSGHVGILATYLERLAEEGAIGLALTTSEALVHPAGGRDAMVGTNPIGIGIPVEPQPFIFDMSTAAISAGEVIAHRERGRELPPGAAIDADGLPTTDPDAALAGAISPFGGNKGYALGLAFELLVAGLTGTNLGREVHGTLDVDKRSTKGDVLIAIDASDTFEGPAAERLTGYLDELRRTPPAPDRDAVKIPGDRMRLERRRRLEGGIPYSPVTWQRLLDLEGSADA